MGAFSTTDLDQQLRAQAITTLVLAGLSTSGVLTTAREAMDRDYQLVVLHDACADRDVDIHRFLTERLFPPAPTSPPSATSTPSGSDPPPERV